MEFWSAEVGSNRLVNGLSLAKIGTKVRICLTDHESKRKKPLC